jgi:hypothetical protein
LGYILSIIGQNLILVTLNLTISMFTQVHESLMVDIVNSNPLIFFLIANAFTGLINLTVDTLTVEPIFVFLILSSYSVATTFLRIFTLKLSKKKSE